MDGRLILSVGKPVSLRIAYLDGRLMVNSWGGSTTVQLEGIERHELTEDGDGPRTEAEDTDDFQLDGEYV